MQFPEGRLCLQLPGDVFFGVDGDYDADGDGLCLLWLTYAQSCFVWDGLMVFDQEVGIAHLFTMFFKSRTKIEDGPGKRGSQVKELCFR